MPLRVGGVKESGMKWKDEYATAIQRIDKQHKTLFRMVNDFQSVLDNGGGERTYSLLLGFLYHYYRNHFHFEEQCMEVSGCPMTQKSKKEHLIFLATLREYQQCYAASGYLAADAREFVNIVDRWLDEHICRINVYLRNYGSTHIHP